jgi:hypothetical protein
MTVAPAKAVGAGPAASRPGSPYVGLVPYEEDDAEFFFGRSHEAAIVRANLRSARLTIFYGPSGVGKSSLLMAGVVHGLREEARAAAGGPSPFTVCVVRSWLDDPVRALREASRAALQEQAGGRPLPAPRKTLAASLRAWTRRAGALLVVLDQFEEYFQYHAAESDGEQVTGFAAELAEIVNDPDLSVNVLLSIREDAWAKLDRFEGHVPLLFANYLRVDHLDLDAAREAIEGPIEAWNRTLPRGAEPYSVEPELVEEVLAAAGAGLTLTAGTEAATAPSALGDRIEAPFLQLVLERLWRATVADGGRVLTRARLEALGGARQIVENHLLQALGRLTVPEQDAASDCFRFLVSSSKTKIAHPAADLAEWTRRPEAQVTAVLDKLCTAESGRILRAIPAAPDQAPGVSYELFHDLLAEPILAWRRGHEQERARRAARRRLIRIGGFALALVLVFAGLSVWALVERGHANTLFHKQKRTSQKLSALYQVQKEASAALQGRLDHLTKQKKKQIAAAAVRKARVRRLRAVNGRLRADDTRLEGTRAGLAHRVATLRAHNGALAGAIRRLRTQNDRLTTRIDDLDSQYDRLAAELSQSRSVREKLLGDAGILRAEDRALNAQLVAARAQHAELEQKAAELGQGAGFSKPASNGIVPAIKTKVEGEAGGVAGARIPPAIPGSDVLRRRVERLQSQLAQLLARRARLADEARWLRKANRLLTQQRTALREEIHRLGVVEAALVTQERKLRQMLGAAREEHHRLTSEVASRRARNGKRRSAVEAARRQSTRQQTRNHRLVADISATRNEIADVRAENQFLLDRIVPGMRKLLSGARDSANDPALAGLLAVKAYRVTPFDADSAAHPGVYNALWIALDRLDPKTASALIAPVTNPRGKVGTTRSAVLVQKICGLVKRGFTQAEWSRFLPDARYTSTAARPCTHA